MKNSKFPAERDRASLDKVQSSKSHRGFTLIELVIYIGLLSLLLVFIMGIFLSVLDIQLESQANSSVEQDERYIISRMSYDMSRETTVTEPALIGSQSATLQFSTSGNSYTYSLNNDKLELTSGSEVNELNSYDTSITGLSFQRIGNGTTKDTIVVHFTISSKTKRASGPQTKNVSIVLGVR